MEKNLAPASFDKISSKAGMTGCSLRIALFRFLVSRHILNWSLDFLRYTRLFTQAVGSPSLSLTMISLDSMSSSSPFMPSRRLSETSRWTWTTEVLMGPQWCGIGLGIFRSHQSNPVIVSPSHLCPLLVRFSRWRGQCFVLDSFIKSSSMCRG